MIQCNLAVLLAERNLKISKVASDTGISRTTLTSLVNNYSQGIQFDTLNSLCVYLRITPEKLFSFAPFEVTVKVAKIELDAETVDISLLVHERGDVVEEIPLEGHIKIEYLTALETDMETDESVDVDIVAMEVCLFMIRAADCDVDHLTDRLSTNERLVLSLRQIPMTLKKAIEEIVCKAIHRSIKESGYYFAIPIDSDHLEIKVELPRELY